MNYLFGYSLTSPFMLLCCCFSYHVLYFDTCYSYNIALFTYSKNPQYFLEYCLGFFIFELLSSPMKNDCFDWEYNKFITLDTNFYSNINSLASKIQQIVFVTYLS